MKMTREQLANLYSDVQYRKDKVIQQFWDTLEEWSLNDEDTTVLYARNDHLRTSHDHLIQMEREIEKFMNIIDENEWNSIEIPDNNIISLLTGCCCE